MSIALRKIRKSKSQNASPLETALAKELFQLEIDEDKLKKNLGDIHINSAEEIPVGNEKVTLVYYPLRFVRKFRKIGKTLIERLEKKLERKVIFVATRKIQRKPADVYKLQEMRRCMTMAHVHDEILSDILFPAEITGRRWKYNPDGSRKMKVFLDAKKKDWVRDRKEVFKKVFFQLTRKNIEIGLMKDATYQQPVE